MFVIEQIHVDNHSRIPAKFHGDQMHRISKEKRTPRQHVWEIANVKSERFKLNINAYHMTCNNFTNDSLHTTTACMYVI